MDSSINAKADIKEFGEVFTPDKIVNDMLDLIDNSDEWKDLSNEEYITKTFLEPACGDGQFLVRILYRKLKIVKELSPDQQELALIKALCSIYGVDIQEKNVDASRKRMKALLLGQEVTTFGREREAKPNKIEGLAVDIQSLDKIIDFILTKNILVGNTLEESEFSDDFVYLTSYKWDSDNSGNLTIAKCPITNLDYELDKKDMNYKDFADKYIGEHIEVGDIAERYRGYSFWNESKEQTKTDKKPKKDTSSISSTYGAYNL